jgi:ubiquinone/menaquinone biosynthesis C-methylase UbiE
VSADRQLGGGRVGSSLQGSRGERRDREGIESHEIAGVVDLDSKRVLDVGCGTGRLTRFAARHARSVYAFDPSEDSIAEAEAALTAEEQARVQFAVHDAEALDVPRRRFDLALCGWSL